MFKEEITTALSFLGKVDIFKDDENGWAWYLGRTLLVHEGSRTHRNIVRAIQFREIGDISISHTIINIILADLCKRYDTLAESVDNMHSNIEKAIGNVFDLLWHDCAD